MMHTSLLLVAWPHLYKNSRQRTIFATWAHCLSSAAPGCSSLANPPWKQEVRSSVDTNNPSNLLAQLVWENLFSLYIYDSFLIDAKIMVVIPL